MSDNFYAGLAAMASRLLRDKGQPLLLRHLAGDTTDTFGAEFAYPAAMIDGKDVLRTDARLILESQVEPVITDFLYYDLKDHAVISVRRLAPGGIAVIYVVQARAGG